MESWLRSDFPTLLETCNRLQQGWGPLPCRTMRSLRAQEKADGRVGPGAANRKEVKIHQQKILKPSRENGQIPYLETKTKIAFCKDWRESFST